MAVGVCLCDRTGAGRGAATRSILDDEGLTDMALHLLEHGARHEIGSAAVAERNDDPDWFGGPSLAGCLLYGNQRQE
jgi:hypothetical protein